MEILVWVLIGLLILVVGVPIAAVCKAIMSAPPREVPPGLNAQQYYDLGVKYKLGGWIAQSKQSLRLSAMMDQGAVSKQAGMYLKAYLPYNDIPEEAVSENISAVNLGIVDKDGAEKAFRSLMEKHPNFEWPFGNLGHLYFKQGRTEEAKAVLDKALEINPNYVNGMIHLAAVYQREDNEAETDKLLKDILRIDPEVRSNVLASYPDLAKRVKTLQQHAG
ncbi:MAG: tetratricopeptide repeat protein [Candidatus Obscuribacterales bacterium]|nr:tetratricopeptide repeat protein [Candidatus Obscuribacterales bacterium]